MVLELKVAITSQEPLLVLYSTIFLVCMCKKIFEISENISSENNNHTAGSGGAVDWSIGSYLPNVLEICTWKLHSDDIMHSKIRLCAGSGICMGL